MKETEISRIGKRGYLLKCYGLPLLITQVYLIHAKNRIYLIDTFLGSDSMKPVKKLIEKEFHGKEIIIINTHYDWDHIWGNCAFPGNIIIGHELCRKNIIKFGDEQFMKCGKLAQGEVKIIAPNLTFKQNLHFTEDGIILFHSPGHTDCSISVFDEEDRVLIAGDNIESPLPYVNDRNFSVYIQTLEDYLKLDFLHLITGHTPEADAALIRENIQYLRDLHSGNTGKYHSGKYAKMHKINLSAIASQ